MLANSSAPNNKRLSIEAGHILEQHLLSKRNRAGAYAVQVPPHQAHTGDHIPQGLEYPPLPQHFPPPLEEAHASVDAISGGRDRRPPCRSTGPKQGAKAEFKLCYPHSRYGTQAFSCQGGTCPMQGVPLAPRPQAQGNGRAGR